LAFKFYLCSRRVARRQVEGQMARIPREAHATIRERVDVEKHKVADVAAAYGCTPANIYAILAKQRQQPGQTEDEPAPPPERIVAAPPADPVTKVPTDLFGQLAEATPDHAPAAVPARITPEPAATPPALSAAPEPAPAQPSRIGPVSRGAAPASTSRAKSGFALLMRTSDGEEATNPFRSLDELLSASKPLLRTAARSPEPIWFSIQPVDLAAQEDSF
jgi:hypothetical protein